MKQYDLKEMIDEYQRRLLTGELEVFTRGDFVSVTRELADKHAQHLEDCRYHLKEAQGHLDNIEKIEAMLESQGVHLKRTEKGFKEKFKELMARLAK